MLGAAVAAWWLWPSSCANRQPPDTDRQSCIKDIRPPRQKPLNAAEALALATNATVKKDFGYYTNKLGQIRQRTGKPFVIERNYEKQLFSNAAENEIAAVISLPVGEMVLDTDVPEDFEEDFKAAMTNRIEFSDDDTPQEREEKERVIAAKGQLRKMWLLGQDVRQILIEEKKDMQKLWETRQDLLMGLHDLRDSGAGIEEIGDYVVAAKKLMKDRGIEAGLSLEHDEEAVVKEFEKYLEPQNEGNKDERVQ